jgi:DNA topoisomerase-3
VRQLTDEVIFSQAPIRIQLHTDEPVVKEKPKRERKPTEKVSLADLDCPKCKQHKLMQGRTGVGCANYKVCGFLVPFELLGKKLTEKQLIDLIQKGKTTKMKGLMIPGAAQVIEGSLAFDDTYNVIVMR